MLVGYHNLFDTASVITPTSEATGYEIANAYDWRLVTWWQLATAASYMDVVLDMGSAISADYVAIAGHDVFSTLGANAKIAVHGSTDNFSASDDTVATFDVDTDGPVLGTFTSASYRYWKIRIYETGLATHQSLVGQLCLGQRYTLSQPLWTGVKLPYEARNNNIRNNVSQKGNHLGRSYISQGVAGRLDFNLMTLTETRSTFRTFMDHAELKPFFLAWDEVNYPADVVFCWPEGVINTPTPSQSTFVKASIPFEGRTT